MDFWERRERVIGLTLVTGALLVVGFVITLGLWRQGDYDASRWNTVWNLVHRGTYATDGGPWGDRPDSLTARDAPTGASFVHTHTEGPFLTIDKVRWPCGHDSCPWEYAGRPYGGSHFYSSKPPLLATLVAGVYAPLRGLSAALDGEGGGWVLASFPEDATGDATRRVEPVTEPVAGRVLLVLVNLVPFGLFLLAFRRWTVGASGSARIRLAALAVAAGGTYLTAYSRTLNNHVPAAFLVFFAAVSLLRVLDGSRRRREFVLIGGACGTAAVFELPAAVFLGVAGIYLVRLDWRRAVGWFLPAAMIPVAALLLTNWLAFGFLAPAQTHLDEHDPANQELYHYEGSYWNAPVGMDALEDSRWLYLTNMTVGHHGILSLSPILLFAFVGLGLWTRDPRRRSWAGTVFAVTAVVLVFYLFRTDNYGGQCSGMRWTFWLIPLWLTGLPRGMEAVTRRPAGWAVIGVALAVSGVSVVDALITSPFTTSWLQHGLAAVAGLLPN